MGTSRARATLFLVVLTATYAAAGKLGLSLAFVNESASAVWPPTGIALAAFLLLGTRVWPAVTVGAFLVNATTTGAVVPSLIIAAGNTAEGLAGAWLVRRYAGGAAAFDRAADVFRFAALAGVVATSLAATVGAGTLLMFGLATRDDAGSIWLTWWLGDAVGAVVVAPLLILWATRRRAPNAPWWEAVVFAVTLMAASIAVFGVARFPLEFLIMPILLWAAFRFAPLGTASATFVVAVIAVAGTLRGVGPFAREAPNESLLLLQAFIGVVSVVMLAVAAEAAGRPRTEELLRMQARLVEAQRVAHVGSWEWEIPANRLWWSDELYRIYGVPPGEASYEDFIALVHPDDRERIGAAVRRAMESGEAFSFEHRIVRPDGVERVVHGQGHVVRDAAGQPVRMTGTGHDITDFKRAEEERARLIEEQAALREAEAANRAKDQFLATLSHELRTPLNAALGWSQMLRDASLDDIRRQRGVETIYRNLLVQARLVSDIMDISRITMGTMQLESASVDLPPVMDAAIETVRELAEAKRITIHTRGVEGAALLGDGPRLQQVVWNLLSNAVKFAPEGGRVDVRVEPGPADMVIVVEDNGPGIDETFLPFVFERFRQADPSMTRNHGGLGLGLAIVRHIVELHGGSVAAANRDEGGARFTVRLPVQRPAAGETAVIA